MRRQRLSSFTHRHLAGEGWSWDPSPAWSEHTILAIAGPGSFFKDDFRETAGPPAIKENASAVNVRCFYVPKQARFRAEMSPQTVFKYQRVMSGGERKRLPGLIPAPTCGGAGVYAAVRPGSATPARCWPDGRPVCRRPLPNNQ